MYHNNLYFCLIALTDHLRVDLKILEVGMKIQNNNF